MEHNPRVGAAERPAGRPPGSPFKLYLTWQSARPRSESGCDWRWCGAEGCRPWYFSILVI